MSTTYRHLVRCILLCLLVMSSFALGTAPALADARTFERQTAAIDKALAWLLAQQQEDGSWVTAFGHPAGITLDALLAGVAAGQDVGQWRRAPSQPDVLSYLATTSAAYCTSAAATGKLVAGLAAAGVDPSDIGGFDAEAKLRSFIQADGRYGAPEASDTLADQAWAMIAFSALRSPIDAKAISNLLGRQNGDGGWGWATQQASDADSTALAIQALMSSGTVAESEPIRRALSYLKTQQGPSGAIDSWGAPNVSSTAYALQALVAAGQNPLEDAWKANGKTLLDGLLSLQADAGGFMGFDGSADVFATAQAIPALAGAAYPLPSPVVVLQAALGYLRSLQQADEGLDEGLMADMLIALATADQQPTDWKDASGKTLVDDIVSLVGQADNAGKAGRLLLAFSVAEIDPTRSATSELIRALQSFYDPATGSFDPNHNIWNQAYAILALAKTTTPAPAKAISWLAESQNPDGGWPWAIDFPSDGNSTSLAVQALAASHFPADSFTIRKAAAYLRSLQTTDGGFRYDTSPLASASDGNSTALAMQAFSALGIDTITDWRYARPSAQGIGIHRPIDRLYQLQTVSGAFQWLPENGDNALATLQIVPILAGRVRSEIHVGATGAQLAAPTAARVQAKSAETVSLGEWEASLNAWRKGMLLTGSMTSPIPAASQVYTSGLAAVVVQFDAERYVARIVPLYGDAPTGWDVVSRAGLPIADQEGLVCRIGDVGCPPDNCFCSKDSFWSYWHLDADAWQMAMTGAGGRFVGHGFVEGWRWGQGDAPVSVRAAALLDPLRLAPGAPRIVASGSAFVARVDYLGDIDADAKVMASARTLGDAGSTAIEPVSLTRLATLGLFTGSLGTALKPGDYEVCLSYSDPDGVNGSDVWCAIATMPQR